MHACVCMYICTYVCMYACTALMRYVCIYVSRAVKDKESDFLQGT